MNHQVLQELMTAIDAWLAKTDECAVMDNYDRCPLRKALIEKRKTLINILRGHEREEEHRNGHPK